MRTPSRPKPAPWRFSMAAAALSSSCQGNFKEALRAGPVPLRRQPNNAAGNRKSAPPEVYPWQNHSSSKVCRAGSQHGGFLGGYVCDGPWLEVASLRKEPGVLLAQSSGGAQRTLFAAISRSATTISRLSETTRGFDPFNSCRARCEASMTSSKRLETLSKQSSTVILAIANTVGLGSGEHKGNFCGFALCVTLSSATLHNQ